MSLQSLPQSPAVPGDWSEPGWLTLVRTVAQLAAATDLPQIIDIVRSTARDISGADGVCFVLRDGEQCHYVDENSIAPLWKGKRFPLTACISGWAMLNDQTAVIPDIYLDPRIPIDAYRPTFVKSLVVVPVHTTTPVAAIGFYWGYTRQFGVEELTLIDALGRSASAAFSAVQAHDRLADSEKRLSMALEAGGLGAYEIDLVTGKAVATPTCTAIFGYRGETPFSRKDIVAAIHPDDRDKAMTLFSTGINTDPVYRLPGAERERRVELWGRLVVDESGRSVRLTGVVRDITEQIAAKEKLDDLLAELLRASRLNDLGTMASALAHELNQPLAAGSNYLKAAERLLAKDPDKAVEAMAKAGGQFVRTKEIVQRIRGFVGHGQSARQAEDVEQMLGEILELARITTRHDGVQVSLTVVPGLPKIEIDKVQIQQVLFNLLRNAAEALEDSPVRQIAVTAIAKDGHVELRVSDSGPGLAPEIAEHLFQPFHTSKDGGMGVGLSLCRKIVEGHGGRLWYEGPEISGAHGATFAFSLPAA